MPSYLSFTLPDEFVEGYGSRPITWGFPCGGGLSLGELTFVDKYSRLKDDGTKETWPEVCRRVIEGTYSILKDHCHNRRTPWDEDKALRSAREAYERMFTFRWLPPGRGLAMMGTAFVHENRNSAALQNCAFVSTGGKRGLVGAAHRLMEMSMLGVGVGFDSEAAKLDLRIHAPVVVDDTLVVEDSREGWCDSTALIISAFLRPDGTLPSTLDYSLVRPQGSPIRGYGGVASGPAPLIELHEALMSLFSARAGETVDVILVGDIMNLIGRCVVAGGVRRTAEIWLCEDDKDFLNAKNAERYPERMASGTGWGWSSNNSVIAEVGTDYTHLAESIARNGEPGLVYLDLCRDYGRLGDPADGRDYRVAGINPCAEQALEDGELCTLVNAYPTRCDDKADYERTLKFAYLYAKAVTLLPTHWEDANEIMRRNHRIGTSLAGQAQFVETRGWTMLKDWQNSGYHVIQDWDRIYSEWLGVRQSIKTTTTKPDGSTALLVGCTPGVGWPTFAGWFLRRFRFSAGAPIVDTLRAAGVPIEPDVTDPRRVVAELPARGPDVPGEWDVSIWKKAELAAATQHHWSDNSVSVTLSFRPDEADQIADIIQTFDGRLKALSFLPMREDGGAYAQMPFEKIDEEELERRFAAIESIDRRALYGLGNDDADIDKFCTTDRCELPGT